MHIYNIIYKFDGGSEMAEHERATPGKHEEVDKKHRQKQQGSKPLFDQSLAWDTGSFSLTETPFYPRMDEHAAILSRIPFSAQRREFITQLHQTYGNRYVQRLVESMNVQAKLTVSDPGDIYEQEADRVADAVTRAVNSPVQRQEEEEEIQTKASLAQCQPEEEEEELQANSLLQQQPEEEEEVQMQPAEEEEEIQAQPGEEEEEIQAQPGEGQPAAVAGDLETRINSARGSGQPLSDDVREPMEQAFGADFSNVRVHTDSESHLLNQKLSAKAFTTARDIFFRQGEYSPGSDSGRKLIAHELTHVVQQNNGRAKEGSSGMTIRPPGDTLEQEADATAREVTSVGYNVEASYTTMQDIQPQSNTQMIIQRFELADLTAEDISPLEKPLSRYYDAEPTLKLRPIDWDLISSEIPRIRLKAVRRARTNLGEIFSTIKFEFASKDKATLVDDLFSYYPEWMKEREEQELREKESRMRREELEQMAREARALYEENPPVGWSGALPQGDAVANKADCEVKQGASNLRGLKITGTGQGLWTGGAGPCVVVALAGPGAVAMVHLDSDTYGKDKCLSTIQNLVAEFAAKGGRGGKAYIWGGNDQISYIHQFRHVYEALKPNVEYWNPTVASGEPISQVQIVLRYPLFELEKL